MIIGVEKTRNNRPLTFGTHNGIFHCDEVIGIAILELANMNTDAYVVRTRNKDVLNGLDVVIDVGGKKYDHHQAGFDQRRSTGEKYASAGLIWRDFAEKAIKNVAIEGKMSIDDDEISVVKGQIDKEIIIFVDMEDNGKEVGTHIFSFIPSFYPAWFQDPEYDEAFMKVERIVFSIMREIIKEKIVQIATRKEIEKKCNSANDGVLEIPVQTMPWQESVVNFNETHAQKINFVIFPYPDGGWAAQCVPPSMEKKFEQRIPFPKKWAGGNEKTLPEVSGISDATFCHNGRFFARAKTKESVLKMCKIASSELL